MCEDQEEKRYIAETPLGRQFFLNFGSSCRGRMEDFRFLLPPLFGLAGGSVTIFAGEELEQFVEQNDWQRNFQDSDPFVQRKRANLKDG